jgi:pectin methylesterase-like acyl-CoA thioesterase
MFSLQNKIVWELVSLLFLIAIPAVADISVYSACQAPTPNPLDGCPKNTLVVSSTPGDCSADFSTIQGAIDSLDNTTSYTILIKPGNYIEQVNVTRSGPLTLLGQTQNPTQQANNTVTIYWASADVSGRYTDNAYTSVLTVAPTLNASLTGSGNTGFPVPADTPFGCADFRVYNVDIRNVYADLGVGPSLAVSISRANAGFYYSGIYSYQDTVSWRLLPKKQALTEN